MQPCPTGYTNVPFKRNNSLITSYVVDKNKSVDLSVRGSLIKSSFN